MIRLKELRRKKDITQEELAKQLQLSPSTIGMYETGRREPDFETLERIAAYFAVTTDYLLGLADSPTLPPKISTFIQEVLASENKRFILEAIKTMPDEDVAEVGRYVVFRQLLRQQPKLELLLGHDPFNKKPAANGEKGETL